MTKDLRERLEKEEKRSGVRSKHLTFAPL